MIHDVCVQTVHLSENYQWLVSRLVHIIILKREIVIEILAKLHVCVMYVKLHVCTVYYMWPHLLL